MAYNNHLLTNHTLMKIMEMYPIFDIDLYDPNKRFGDSCIYFKDRGISKNPINIAIKGPEVVISGSKEDRYLIIFSLNKNKGSFHVGNNNIVVSDHYGELLLDCGIILVDQKMNEERMKLVPLYDQVVMKRRSVIKNIINE